MLKSEVLASYKKEPAMKTFLSLLLVCGVAGPALAQTQTPPQHKHHKKSDTNSPAGPAAAAPDPSVDQAKQVAEYQKSFVPTDPWRIMNDKTNFARGGDWVQFEGRVTRVSGDGVVLQGTFGEPLFYLLPNNGGATSTTFVVSNYPRGVGVGQVLSRNDRLVAFKAGTKDDMPLLDYATVYVPQLTEEQKTQIADNKSKADAKVLAWHKELAEKGDAYGEYKMGLRYLNGDGVEKDPAKAKDFFGKAAAQGNKDAADELAKLSPSN
jgi:TPR repeat protein